MAYPGDGFKLEPVRRGPTLKKVLFVYCLFGILFLVLAPVFERAKFHARLIACHSNLKEIGKGVQDYRVTHGGKVPPDVNALVKNVEYQSVLTCPEHWKTSYIYRASNNPGDIICWDGAMHFHARYLLSQAIRNRNVLFGNGDVKTINEDDFEKLHLKGTPILPDVKER